MYTFELLFYGNNNLSDSEAVQFDMMQRTVRQEPTPRMMREASERLGKKVSEIYKSCVQKYGIERERL